MNYLITGFSGQLGYDVYNELLTRGVDPSHIYTPSSKEMDLTNEDNVLEIIERVKPGVIFHCAAWTNVDGAETDMAKCAAVNVNGTKNMTIGAKDVGAKLIVLSTDYVFDGTKDGIYTEEDLTNPQNVYGRTKVLAENIALAYEKAYAVRTSWVFGINGKNFIKTMIRLGNERKELGVVCDQVGSPTYTVDLARLLVDMSETEKYGLYHATSEGYTSWADFARYIFEEENLDVTVNDILTKDYVQAAKRPLNSRLSKDKLEENGFKRLPSWQDATDRYLLELKRGK